MMTMIEDRIRAGLEAEAKAIASTGRTPTSRRASPLLGVGTAVATAAVVLIVIGGVAILTGGGSDVASEGSASSSLGAGPTPTSPPTAQMAVAEFWAETLALKVDTIFPGDSPAQIIEYGETGDPRAGEGSLKATVASADEQLTFGVEYKGHATGEDRDSALQDEIADMRAAEDTRHIGTLTHTSDDARGRSETSIGWSGTGYRVSAEYFLTESGSRSALVTVLTAPGRLVVQVEVTDPSLLPDVDRLRNIAIAMIGTALDLANDPDQPLSTDAEPRLAPTADQWTSLDDDIWVASVPEGEEDRLWVKTDTQEATPAPSTDTRSLHAYSGPDLVIIIVGQPVPNVVTVEWDDGTTESVEPDWNTELDMGIARFRARAAELVSVEGP
jgi:hypothetical protein